MKQFLLSCLTLSVVSVCCAQVYVEKQTRHRFAQLNMGLDVQSSFGGETKYLDAQGAVQSLPLPGSWSPRFVIGGTHFWGHADFYIAIPVYYAPVEASNQEVSALRGVETVFKYYPWRIEDKKVRPYLGASLAPFYFEQRNNNFEYTNGPELNHTSFPLHGGFTFNAKNYLVDLGLAWNYQNKQDYYLSRSLQAEVFTPPVYFNASVRYMLETTVGAEKDWESGRTEEITKALGDQGRLSGFYVGAGLSSAFWLGNSTYNEVNRPYVEKYNTSLMPDFTIGYHLFKPDMNVAVGYRGYGTATNAYGLIQQLSRRSVLVEATKFLFDYQGFAPFVGPVVSYETLSFTEDFEGQRTADVSDNRLAYGLTFGWDIRPNRIQSFILRTNLRWYPRLLLEVEPESSVSFTNLEFNFIQLILYPDRLFKRKAKS